LEPSGKLIYFDDTWGIFILNDRKYNDHNKIKKGYLTIQQEKRQRVALLGKQRRKNFKDII